MSGGARQTGRLPAALAQLARRLERHGRDTVWALFDQGTSLVASMLSFFLLGRTLGTAGYGAFVGLYALIGPFLALSQSGVFLGAMEHVVRNRERPEEVARSYLSLALANALVCVPVLTAVSLRFIEGLPLLAALLIIGGEFVLNGVVSTAVGMAQAVVGFPAAARLRMLTSLARIAVLVALAWTGTLSLTTLGLGQVATLSVVAAVGMVGISRKLGVVARPGRIVRRHAFSAALYGLGIGASMAQSDGDKFVLNAAHHQDDAGRYGAAYRLMQIAILPVSALVNATHLSFLSSGDSPRAQLRRALRLSLFTLAYALPAVGGLVLVAPWIPRFLTKDFAQSTYMLQVLAPVVILRGVGVYPMNGLMGLGRNALRTGLLVGNALLSLALYFALIPAYSWRGAVVATLVSEITLTASGWIALLACQRPRAVAAAAAEAG